MKVLLEALHRLYTGHSGVRSGPDWEWIGLQISDRTRLLDSKLWPIV